MRRSPAPLAIVTAMPGAGGSLAVAAALAVTAARRSQRPAPVVLCDVSSHTRRPTLLSSAAARALESELRGDIPAVARGVLCWVSLDPSGWRTGLARCVDAGAALVVTHLESSLWRQLIADPDANVAAAVIRADLPEGRHLAALLAIELRGLGLPNGVVIRAPGLVGSRRALAGIEPGGPLGARAARLLNRLLPVDPRARLGRAGGEAGQALPLVIGLILLTVLTALLLTLLGVAASGGARLQRAADLAAVSAARSLRDDHPRLFLGARLPSGAANPARLSESDYRRRARAAALDAAAANDIDPRRVSLRFRGSGFAPTRVRVAVGGRIALGDRPSAQRTRVVAVAEAYPAAAGGGLAARVATGGGYSGPLAGRQGESMRPDVAIAFDRLAAAARRAGHALLINSAFRSDAEQAALFAANPDPRWVAPPGTSLHRCATELDLGPSSAYAWLGRNAGRFGFLRRYPWEPWHYGYVAGPAPCLAVASRATGAADGATSGRALPSFVPTRFRRPIARAARRWDVPAAVLAAQLLAESNFNPLAVSPAGARGIAQFMPGTAASYGLRDPFDPRAAIDAQAELMSDLIRQFGSVPLALAAYNAGPAPVGACRCVPPYPETQAYVTRILGLLGGAGVAAPPQLEVRLVR